MPNINGYIFDLDGVIVDTARFHFLSWRETARELGFELTEEDNERLKGVSRMESLEIILKLAGISLDEGRKRVLAQKKNSRYLEWVETLRPSDTLPGVVDFLRTLKEGKNRIALASASKNAQRVIALLKVAPFFDAVIDGSMIEKTKPDPEIFIKAARVLARHPERCAVFEDAKNGIEAAKAAGMTAIGIGLLENLGGADWVIPDFSPASIEILTRGGIVECARSN